MSVGHPHPPCFLNLAISAGGVFSQGTPSPTPKFALLFCVYSQETWEEWQIKMWVLTQGPWGTSVSTKVQGLLLSGPQLSCPCSSQMEGTCARG